MKYTGALDGDSVYYNDVGYNPCVWFYEDTKETTRARKVAQATALQELVREFPDAPFSENVKQSWRVAYSEVPIEKVNPDDVPRIRTQGMTYGEEALAHALAKNPF